MRRLAGLAFVAFASVVHAQELDRQVLDRLKASTCFVVVDSPLGRGTGSGFLFLKRGAAGYIITCDHVIRGSETATIVFGSGTAQEKTYTGKVIAGDDDRDLACVILKNAKDLPVALELGEKTVVAETQAVYAAGFPFGKMLAAGDKNPEISIAKAAVSSIRRDPDARVTAVQLGGEVNPGNSGGPVVDAKGRVIGVAQSKVLGTSTAFAVPPEQIHGFLRGRVAKSSFARASQGATSVKFDAKLTLIDPLGTLKGAGIAWCSEKLFAEEPKPGPGGEWGKAHASMKQLALKIDEDEATGSFEVTRAASEPGSGTLYVQVYYNTPDGKTRWTQPVPLDVEFADAGAPAAKPDANAPAPAPAGKGVDIPVGDDVKVLASLRLKAAIAELLLSPDGGYLYALDLSEGKVYQLKPDTLEIAASVDTIENAVTMCLTPDGKTIYVGGRDPGYQKQQGYVQVISTSGLKVSSTFPVAAPIHRLAATNSGTLAATCVGQWDGLAVIDASKKSVQGTSRFVYGGSSLRMHPDQTRVYTGDLGLSPPDFRCTLLRKGQNNQYESYDSPYHGDHPLGGEFEITPDGRFIIGCYGSVVRLAKTKDADLRFVGKIDKGIAVGVGKNSNTFVLSTAEGFLKVYDLEKVELKKSVKIDRLCPKIALDASKGRLYAVACAISADQRSRGYLDPYTYLAGDIVSLSLTGKQP